MMAPDLTSRAPPDTPEEGAIARGGVAGPVRPARTTSRALPPRGAQGGGLPRSKPAAAGAQHKCPEARKRAHTRAAGVSGGFARRISCGGISPAGPSAGIVRPRPSRVGAFARAGLGTGRLSGRPTVHARCACRPTDRRAARASRSDRTAHVPSDRPIGPRRSIRSHSVQDDRGTTSPGRSMARQARRSGRVVHPMCTARVGRPPRCGTPRPLRPHKPARSAA
jgi:hypothetical protein